MESVTYIRTSDIGICIGAQIQIGRYILLVDGVHFLWKHLHYSKQFENRTKFLFYFRYHQLHSHVAIVGTHIKDIIRSISDCSLPSNILLCKLEDDCWWTSNELGKKANLFYIYYTLKWNTYIFHWKCIYANHYIFCICSIQ